MPVVGHNRNAHAKSAKNDTKRNGTGPSNTMAQFGTLLLRQMLPFQISPVPNFPLCRYTDCGLLLFPRAVEAHASVPCQTPSFSSLMHGTGHSRVKGLSSTPLSRSPGPAWGGGGGTPVPEPSIASPSPSGLWGLETKCSDICRDMEQEHLRAGGTQPTQSSH